MKISDTVVGVGFVGAGASIVVGTLNYPPLDGGHPGPALLPRLLGTLRAVLALAPRRPVLCPYAAFASAASDQVLSAQRYFIAGWLIETLSPLRPLSIEILDPISRA